MISYEQDPDVVQWGLQLFDGDPLSNCSYGDSLTPNDAHYYHGEYVTDGIHVMDNIHADDDGITNNLQTQLSHFELIEMGNSHPDSEQSQSPNYSHGWIDQLANFNSGHACEHEVTDEIRPSASCCPCREPYSNVWVCTLDVIDEYSIDGEVGKRLDQMNPIPHVPRINGEIPSFDEATLDHQRLLYRLQMYQLVELKVQGDGNCQFRALSDQFYRTIEHHEFVRQQVVDQLKSNREVYEGYVPMEYSDYLEKMSRNGEWGDHVTLQAAADSYGVKVFVVTSFKDTCYIEIIPTVQKSKRVICLSFWAEVHYNSIYPEGDTLPTKIEVKKKKRRPPLNEIGTSKHLQLLSRFSTCPNFIPFAHMMQLTHACFCVFVFVPSTR
uniref:ubiquitinyl hydrolase 1 n=2 Tax=Kalanchoe fedtschenkoi TaxID=63787 RepID=A0A7N0RDF1_KALFE